MTSCSLVHGYRHLGRTNCHHVEHKCSMFLKSTGNYLLLKWVLKIMMARDATVHLKYSVCQYMISYLRRLWSKSYVSCDYFPFNMKLGLQRSGFPSLQLPGLLFQSMFLWVVLVPISLWIWHIENEGVLYFIGYCVCVYNTYMRMCDVSKRYQDTKKKRQLSGRWKQC